MKAYVNKNPLEWALWKVARIKGNCDSIFELNMNVTTDYCIYEFLSNGYDHSTVEMTLHRLFSFGYNHNGRTHENKNNITWKEL